MVGPGRPDGEAGWFAGSGAGYGPDMPDETEAEEVGQEKQDQVLQREGFEEELMQQGRSDEAENIAEVETGEENL
jgi:hypothetical protein